MLAVHALIGIGEALITVAALTFILQTRPDLLGSTSESAKGSRGWVVAGVLISLAVVLLSPLASADPDGLERVAGDLGFLSQGASAPYGILPDYTVPFLGNTPLSTILAGTIGMIVAGVIIVLLGQGMKAKS
jgi:cobalt/nickel transport system permease protein